MSLTTFCTCQKKTKDISKWPNKTFTKHLQNITQKTFYPFFLILVEPQSYLRF